MNNTENIEQHLTKTAKEQLDKILLKEKENILKKAEEIAKNQANLNNLEISVRDILEAKDGDIIEVEKDIRNQRKKETVRKIVMLSGVIYSVLGVVIYLFQNKTINIQNDIGLIVAGTGFAISLAAQFVSELVPNKGGKLNLSNAQYKEDNQNDALIIVGRWMLIEKMLANKIKSVTGVNVTSFNQIVSYINSDDFNPDLAVTIKNLLKTRNAVVHNQIDVSENLVKGYVHLAGEVIQQLEDGNTEKTL